MRQNPNAKRSRGRGGRKGGNPRSQVYDSNGPGARVRGNAVQVFEKYQQLARDAAASGDRIAAENLLQHAEHYYRLMVAAGIRAGENREGDGGRDGYDRRYDGDRMDERGNGHDSRSGEGDSQIAAADDESAAEDALTATGGDSSDHRSLRLRRPYANGANGAYAYNGGPAGTPDDGEVDGRPASGGPATGGPAIGGATVGGSAGDGSPLGGSDARGVDTADSGERRLRRRRPRPIAQDDAAGDSDTADASEPTPV
jgi:hypothetical protein